MDKYSIIKDALENMDNDSLFDLWREYCEANSCNDDQIYENNEAFFEEHFPDNVIEAIRAVQYGEYNLSDDYVCFDGYANLQSFNCLEADNSPVDFSDLASWLEKNNDNDELNDLLNTELDDEDDNEAC